MTYFISNRYDGCWYYRCYLPMLYNGFKGDKISLRSAKISNQESSQLALQSDIVVYHRPDSLDKVQSALLLKKAGKKIVFDNDDTYQNLGENKIGRLVEEKQTALNDFIRIADLVTTTTEFLANEYRKLNKNVVVLKNCVDVTEWPRKKKNEGDVCRIGIFGSSTLNGDFEPIKELLEYLSSRKDIKIVMFGLPAKNNREGVIGEFYKKEIDFWDKLNIEHHPFVLMEDYFKTLNDLKLDIALIPRQDNYFNRCKSNLKFLESSMLEIPVIAQGFEDGQSPYQGKEDSQYMFIAKTKDNWMDMTKVLIQDKELRERMGREAKEYVLANYNIKNHYKAWKEAYSKLC